jgi:hypothetical protein
MIHFQIIIDYLPSFYIKVKELKLCIQEIIIHQFINEFLTLFFKFKLYSLILSYTLKNKNLSIR